MQIVLALSIQRLRLAQRAGQAFEIAKTGFNKGKLLGYKFRVSHRKRSGLKRRYSRRYGKRSMNSARRLTSNRMRKDGA